MSKSAKTNNVTAAMYDTLVRPVITEKSMLSSEAGKVTFLVPLSASKEDVKAAVEAVANALGTDGRILVRESGTEPVVRVMVEAGSTEECEKYVDQVIDVIKSKGYAV